MNLNKNQLYNDFQVIINDIKKLFLMSEENKEVSWGDIGVAVGVGIGIGIAIGVGIGIAIAGVEFCSL